MSDKKYHVGGYVTGTPPQILPVGDHADMFPISEFTKELIEKVAGAMGIRQEQLCTDWEPSQNSYARRYFELQRYTDDLFRQWWLENAICYPLPSDDESL